MPIWPAAPAEIFSLIRTSSLGGGQGGRLVVGEAGGPKLQASLPALSAAGSRQLGVSGRGEETGAHRTDA